MHGRPDANVATNPAATDTAAVSSDRTTLVAFAIAVVAASGNAVSIRYISCQTCEMEPFWGAAVRFGLAAILFAIIVRALRVAFPRGRALAGALLYGSLTFGGGFGFTYWGLVRVPAGLGQVVLACVPLLTFVFALAHRQERFRWGGLLGAALALGGIAVVFGSGIRSGIPLTSLLAILAGAACFAEAAIGVKGFPPVHPAAMNAIGLASGTGILLLASVIAGESRFMPREAQTWTAQVYLIVVGSVGVFSLYLFILQRWPASAAMYQFVLIPLGTILLSAWLQDERITASFLGGSALVLAGVYFGALRQRRSG